ncbi:hypothetical protein [Bacillus sp. AFS014408]|nr:hypothetical protein [Bacillus sp. AFS014408]
MTKYSINLTAVFCYYLSDEKGYNPSEPEIEFDWEEDKDELAERFGENPLN